MGIGLSQIKHVKLPVADVRRSASWYWALFDLELVAEYVEQGEVRGVSLLDRDGGFEIALRQREYCAGQPRLAGFDVFALRAPTEQLVTSIAERCDRLGIQRTEVRSDPAYGAGMDIPDPDGTLVRIVWRSPQAPSDFLGVAFDADGQPQRYHQPRLELRDPTG
ncbi:MAG TPA: VOC family protein [Micromonosporaceae bacterium]|jgi:catechol 2,3-dioxygenase-like lactoylglutathione lyase family enzyme